MAIKILGQSNPTSLTNTTLFTAASDTAVSVIAVCNQGTTPATFRIAIRVAGASIAASQYIAYDAPIDAKASKFLNIGIAVQNTDVVTIYSSSANLSFTASGEAA